MTMAVNIRNLTFSYGETPVLQDINLEVCPGAMMSIIGPNGGGKTTLLKLLLGLLKTPTGSIEIFGKPPSEAHDLIGYMPQFTYYDPQFPITVLEVVMLGRLRKSIFGRCLEEDRQHARQALDRVGMGGFEKRQLHSLSGGQRQRVLIARALAGSPRLLLLDEPTSNVDTAVANRFYELLRELNETMTVLLVSHDLGLVSGIVEKVICINRTAAIHPVSAIHDGILHDAYGTPLNVVHHCCTDPGCRQ
jgi:zinc transport system ATP-binding protein